MSASLTSHESADIVYSTYIFLLYIPVLLFNECTRLSISYPRPHLSIQYVGRYVYMRKQVCANVSKCKVWVCKDTYNSLISSALCSYCFYLFIYIYYLLWDYLITHFLYTCTLCSYCRLHIFLYIHMRTLKRRGKTKKRGVSRLRWLKVLLKHCFHLLGLLVNNGNGLVVCNTS